MGLPFVLDTLREETLTQFLVVPERGGQGVRGGEAGVSVSQIGCVEEWRSLFCGLIQSTYCNKQCALKTSDFTLFCISLNQNHFVALMSAI